MTHRDESDSASNGGEKSEVLVVEIGRNPATWRYQDDSDYVFVERLGTDELRIEVGFDGFSEEPAHSIRLPREVAESLAGWLPPFRRGS